MLQDVPLVPIPIHLVPMSLGLSKCIVFGCQYPSPCIAGCGAARQQETNTQTHQAAADQAAADKAAADKEAAHSQAAHGQGQAPAAGGRRLPAAAAMAAPAAGRQQRQLRQHRQRGARRWHRHVCFVGSGRVRSPSIFGVETANFLCSEPAMPHWHLAACAWCAASSTQGLPSSGTLSSIHGGFHFFEVTK